MTESLPHRLTLVPCPPHFAPYAQRILVRSAFVRGWPQRADPRAARGDRATAHQPGALSARRHQGSEGCAALGPPGTGKTLLARAVANNIDASFLKVVASAIVDKYIGESARLIREMFGYAKDHQPCIIFMDEIDAIGGRRFEGTSADREIQRTLMELLNQLDGFDALGKVKMICATNRPDVLDPALMRPGRLDRKIEIALPNESARVDIVKIHSAEITKKGRPTATHYAAVAFAVTSCTSHPRILGPCLTVPPSPMPSQATSTTTAS